MGNPDRHGYYRILGIDPSASAEAIKIAFRQRSKDLHPDRNKRIGAEMQFGALTEAYKILSDPEARARYDTTGLNREAPGGNATGRDVGTPVPCSRCKQVSAQPRYVIFHRVVGRLRTCTTDHIQGIYCSRCARDVSMAASLLTWALGWWALDGPAKTVRGLITNLKGGERPRGPNHRLMAYQALAFEQTGREQLARALAQEALELDPHGEHAGMAARIAASGPFQPLKNQWGPDPLAVFAQLLPGIILVIGFIVFVPNWAGRPAPPVIPTAPVAVPQVVVPAPVNPARMAHVKVDNTVLRAAPGATQAAMATLQRFEDVTLFGKLVGGGDGDAWQRIRSAELEGYVPALALGAGPGAAAQRVWCGEDLGKRPASGAQRPSDPSTPRGPHTVKANNQTSSDAVVKLRANDGTTLTTFYLRAGESATIDTLPEGTVSAIYASGERYSERCGTFLDDLATFAHVEPLALISTITDGNIYATNATLTLSKDSAVGMDPRRF